jgi:hypothetical protein
VATTHNVRIDNARQTAEKAKTDSSAAQLKIDLVGDWRVDETKAQLGSIVRFAGGERFSKRTPRRSGAEDGRAPSPLIYCFWGALSCYASRSPCRAAMNGMEITALRARVRLNVDFPRRARGCRSRPAGRIPFRGRGPDEGLGGRRRAREAARRRARCPAIYGRWITKSRIRATCVRRGGGP